MGGPNVFPHGVILVFLAGAVAVPFASAHMPQAMAVPPTSTACERTDGPPCGPITVIITIILEKSRKIAFADSGVYETKGTVSYYFDINDEGYWYNATREIWIDFAVTKQPSWLHATFDPPKVQVPYRPWECPQCIKQEGSDPLQWQFFWEGPINVKVEKLREHTAKEVKPWVKSDGMYRLTFRGESNSSMLGTPQTGETAGLLEGYGPKDLRFFPAPSG